MLHWPELTEGPLSLLSTSAASNETSSSELQRVLIAYYRLLHANRNISQSFGWSLNPLSSIIWDSHVPSPARFLAIQCYALQAGMIEGERVEMEQEVIGNMAEVDCPIEYGTSLDDTPEILDGWLLHMTESSRLIEARDALLKPQNYFKFEDGDSTEPIHPAELRCVSLLPQKYKDLLAD